MENLEQKMFASIASKYDKELFEQIGMIKAAAKKDARDCATIATQHYQSEITTLKSKLENREVAIEGLVNVLNDAKLQIEYLHGKFKETGSGNGVLGKIDNVLKQKQNGTSK